MDNLGIKIGIIANEYFDEAIGGFGGFGWLARQAVFTIRKHFATADEPVFLSGNFALTDGTETDYGTRIIFPKKDWNAYVEEVRREQIDILISIDYRPNYDYPLAALPGTPLIFWIQDPRPVEDIEKINTLKIPGKTRTEGIKEIDCTSFKDVVTLASQAPRTITYACPAPSLIDKANKTFNIRLSPADIVFLPYPLIPISKTINKPASPKVVFLGRLDPIKRPWVFTTLAEFFPDVEFILMGKAHFSGEGAWSPENLSPNITATGHLDGQQKDAFLTEAWVLINSSIHEALPVSFIEALQYEIPILSCQNTEDLASLFGYHTGRFDSDGLEGIASFRKGLTELLSNNDERKTKGKEGRRWAETNHTEEIFVTTLKNLFSGIEKKGDTNSDPVQPWGFPLYVQDLNETYNSIRQSFTGKDALLLIDDLQLETVELSGLNITRFFEYENGYYGPPANSETAIAELEKEIRSGKHYLVITSPAFWWLDHYTGFKNYLEINCRRLTGDQRIMIYGLHLNKA